MLNSVCDNCLTTKVGDSTSSTENDIRFKRCSACEIMKYCSKVKSQVSTWKKENETYKIHRNAKRPPGTTTTNSNVRHSRLYLEVPNLSSQILHAKSDV